jgi:Asp-tRNA(Asn)/Glu-tRNA(Gln) amidotransferase A subunit family amidase
MEPLGAAAAAARIAAGELTASELTERCAARIAERDDVVGAWVDWDPEPAAQAAAARDLETPSGPLHGVPVGVKDIIDTADLPTQHGSPIFAGHRPATDAACVAALRAAGAIVLGKTATTEFAAYEPTATTNPHDPARTPGGSSSGSAAAVADGMVPLALGTQTAGSVVRPAAFCGVFGFKASYGRADRRGIGAQAPSLDTLGWFARHADDLALALDLLAGPVGPEMQQPERPRVAIVPTDHWDEAGADTRTAIETAAARLADAGAIVEELDPPEPFPGLTDAQTTIQAFEAAETLGPLRELHEDDLSESLRALLDAGAAIRPEAHVAALALGEDARSRATELFERYDALLTPAARGAAPRGLDTTGDPVFCRAWTLLGTPVLAVPGLQGEHGMPVGVQLVGRPGGDRPLIDLGGRLHALLA